MKFLCLNIKSDGETTGEPFTVDIVGDDIFDLARAIARSLGLKNSLHLLTLWKPNTAIVKIHSQELESLEHNPNATELDPMASIEDYYHARAPEGEIRVLVRFAVNPLDAPPEPDKRVKHDKIHVSDNGNPDAVDWESLLTVKIRSADNINTLNMASIYLNGVVGMIKSTKEDQMPTFFANFLAQLSQKRIVKPTAYEKLDQKFTDAHPKIYQTFPGPGTRNYTTTCYHDIHTPASKLFEVQRSGETSGPWRVVSSAEYEHYMLVLSSGILTNLYAFLESPRSHLYAFLYGIKRHFSSSEGRFMCDEYWDFPLVIALDGKPEKRVYKPKNTLDFRFKGISHVIIEVIADRNKSDLYRMLLQAICLARVSNKLRKKGSDPFIVSAIYIDKDMRATWHYVYDQGGKVMITSDRYELDSPRAGEFLVRLYNAACLAAIESENFSHTTTSIDDAIRVLEGNGYSTMPNIPFRTEEHEILSWTGYLLRSDLSRDSRPDWEPPWLPPPLMRVWSPEGQVVVKYSERCRFELEIFQHLSAFSLNLWDYHIVQPINTLIFGTGPALVFPELVPLAQVINKCTDAQLRSMCIQFLSGVAFLHEHQVAHLDLKPDNILTEEDDSYMDLYIHDLDISKIVEDENTMLSGDRGTRGWVPPEEYSDNEFSAIRADRWMAGKIIFYLLGNIKYHVARDMLLGSFARRLMDRNPEKRPAVRDVIDQFKARLRQAREGLKRKNEDGDQLGDPKRHQAG